MIKLELNFFIFYERISKISNNYLLTSKERKKKINVKKD